MQKIVIRQIHSYDIRNIVEIEKASFTTPWSEVPFLNEIYNTNSIPKVAVLENNVVGYIFIRFIPDEAHLMNLAVHHDFRRRGIATTLMNSVMSELKGKDCRFLSLEVRVSNLIAIKFYERNGFKIVGFRRKYYMSPNEDASLMMRWL
jgi:ribosomal-protein-alanine N-acetyltransferase